MYTHTAAVCRSYINGHTHTHTQVSMICPLRPATRTASTNELGTRTASTNELVDANSVHERVSGRWPAQASQLPCVCATYTHAHAHTHAHASRARQGS